MNLVRRPFLLDPGTSLLLSDSVTLGVARRRQCAAAFGIDESNLLLSPMCSLPLPLYRFRAADPMARRWPGTRPEAMWHPLLWLPNRVAGRYTYLDEEGRERREDDALWAIRVSLELTASGLYDPETGTWVDVLSAAGLDPSDEIDLARVSDWLDGEDDETLDAIDLSEYLTLDPPTWALETALLLRADLEKASWALIADELYAVVSESLDPTNEVGPEGRGEALGMACAAALALLDRVPELSDEGLATLPAGTVEPHGAFFLRAHEVSTGTDPVALDAAAREAAERLVTIRDVYWSVLESLEAAAPQEGVPA